MNLKAKDILKTEGIITLNSKDKLSEAITKFKSSHDAVMVVDDGQFIGLVNPYFSLIKRTYPSSTKLKSCLFSPPKLSLNTSVSEISRLMLESKIHYLPVIDSGNQLLGIVSARRVLKSQVKSEGASKTASDITTNKKYLQTINLNSSFDEVLRFFQITKLSKIVIVNAKNHLQGIVSQFDLLPIFEEPKERMRFFDKGESVSFMKKYTIKHFLKTATIKVSPNTKISEIINLILDKEIGSVIVMKNSLEPENIVTTSDLLKYLFY